MNATIQQIKTAYEVNGMPPKEIAQDFENYDETTIKAILMQHSSRYRQDCGVEPATTNDLNFTDEELDRVNQVIFETALTAEHPDGSIDYKTRLNAAMYIRDDKKGRKEVVRQLRDTNTFNILMLNQQLAKAREIASGIRHKLIEA